MKHTAYITTPPVRSGAQSIPDGALVGNGDLSAILGSSGNGLRVYIAKCDLWKANQDPGSDGGIKPLGYVDIDIPENLYAHYHVEQRMDEAELFCRFAHGQEFVEVSVTVCAVRNDVLFDISASSPEKISAPRFTVFRCNADDWKETRQGGAHIITRVFQNSCLAFPCKVTAGIRAFSQNQYVLTAATNFDSDTFDEDVAAHLRSFDAETYQQEKQAHALWWQNFYSKSQFETDDAQLELNWYACQYHLAICARNKSFPPGIYGNFITAEQVNWHGDYHLNYNYEAPFYAAFSSNHPELTDGYAAPLEAFMEQGRTCAGEYLNCRGLYYPVGLLPKGLFSEYRDSSPAEYEKMFLGQKSNAAYAAVILVMRWNSTRDIAFAKAYIYPFLKAVGEFWEDFLVFENGRYVIYDDAIHEVPYYLENFNPRTYKKHIHAKNSLLSLGLVRMVFRALLDISEALDTDAERRGKWRHILAHISAYPTFYKKCKKVFRYTEKGMAWNKTNSLCLQHIYPAGQVDLHDEKTLQIACNTFSINNRWYDDNATNSVFPCAARLGIDPAQIIKHLKQNYKKFQLPNLLMLHGGGCLENCSLTAAVLNEMVLQSYDGAIRIFPNWDRRISCRFRDLRADGAFLVSAKMENGCISDIEIFSEHAARAVLQNPYDRCVLSSDTGRVYTDRLIEIPFEKHQRITVTKV